MPLMYGKEKKSRINFKFTFMQEHNTFNNGLNK